MTDCVLLPPAAGPSGFTVLAADDDEAVLDLLARILTRAGHGVLLARDGAEALRLFEEHRPDVTLLDIFMPRVTGLEALRRIRASWGDAEVVLVTGMAHTDLVIQALRHGASNFVEKPFRPSALLDQLEWSLLRRGLQREQACLACELAAVDERPGSR
ncbi:MAG: response regulator [Thermodesulfobacteriota bacterium]